MAGTHLSIRMDPAALARLDKSSRKAGTTRSEMAKTLIEEGLRMQAHPGIVFRPGPAGRRAGLAKGPDVWQVMSTFPDRQRIRDRDTRYVARFLALAESDVRLAIAYYASYQAEIDEWIQSNEEEAEEAHSAWLAQENILSP